MGALPGGISVCDRVRRPFFHEVVLVTFWLKLAALAAVVLTVFGAGYQLAAARGDAALKAYQLEAAVARAEQGRKDYEKLVSAVDQVVAADVDIERIRSDTDRMRRAYESRLRKASAAACNAEQAAVARCENLLRESVELIEEGRSLLLRNAAVHDALVSTNIK